MIELSSLVARAHVSQEVITSNLNRALTPQAIVRALAGEEVARLVPFDYCTLVLPEADGGGIRFWRAARHAEVLSDRLSAAAEAFAAAHRLLAEVLDRGTSKLIDERELRASDRDEFGRDVRSVLALPLSIGERSFGLVCFASRAAGVYTSEDMRRLVWLADHVAAVAEAALLRERLDGLRDSLGEIDRLKSGFVNTLVRDVRLPLTSVLGLLELFESKLQTREPFDLEDRQLLSSAIEHGDRMRYLMDNLLEVAQQEDRPLALEPESIKVEQLLEDVAEPLRGEAALRGVELNINVCEAAISMRADFKQARRAISHLLMAALTATPDGGAVNIDAQTITGTRHGDEGQRLVVINIIDSSEGIPAEEVPFVFDAFSRAANSTTSARCRGVGLAIAKRIAAAHGGNVSVRSQLGSGTVYSIVLPSSQQSIARNARRVLIVDDAPELLLLLRKLVARMGYQVETALSAPAALRILREQHIDLLLTDWSMPEMNGGELIMALKRDVKLRHIPSIVLTGHDTDTERRDAIVAGCDRFLVKPVRRDELQCVISELLTAQTARQK
jgi:signal transduction histidine kinase/ActR/RegA family two-component response regulator